jgi:DNA-binding PadR family transcriptional regulator
MNKPIPVSNGILDIKHYEKIGESLWEFLWLIDRMTKINSAGIGIVLGGKPIKWHEFGFGNRKSIYRHLKQLQSNGYIEIKRAPYGLIVTINKAKKIFGQQFLEEQKFNKTKRDVSKMSHPDGTKMDKRSAENVPSLDKNVPSNKDKTVDKTVDKNILLQKIAKDPSEEIKRYKRLPPEKQTVYYRIAYFYEDLLKTNIVSFPKQFKAIKMMLQAGYTEKQITFTIKYMAEDSFYEDKGFDLMTVANNIAHVKASVRKGVKQPAYVSI